MMNVLRTLGEHSDKGVTHSPPTSEVCGSNPGANVGKLVVAFVPFQRHPSHNLCASALVSSETSFTVINNV